MKSFVKVLYRAYSSPIRWLFSKKEKSFPKTQLSFKHTQNCQVVESRSALLNRLAKNGVVAEIGVDNGDFSKEILDKTSPTKLVLIDSWRTIKYNRSKQNNVERLFRNQILNGQVEIKVSDSVKAAQNFNDNYFDWIYLDTDHSYETTKAELLAYAPKVKRQGLIVGHDYCQGTFTNLVRYGVVEAVNEFCINENWELIYLTVESNYPPSFAIRRIKQSAF